MKWLEALVIHAWENLTENEREALYLRGVSDSQIDVYRLGYLDYLPEEITYPSRFLEWWAKSSVQFDRTWVIPLTTPLGRIKGLQLRHVDIDRKGYTDYFEIKDEVALFGLSQAMPHVWETGCIWLVEGAFDLLALQRHVPNIVATLHAGISNPFWRVLSRVADQIYLAYDPDYTGSTHSYKIVREEKAKAFSIKIVKFPRVPHRGRQTKDPNELWEAWGDERLGVFLRQQIDPFTEGGLNARRD